jgi:hypothetical protein
VSQAKPPPYLAGLDGFRALAYDVKPQYFPALGDLLMKRSDAGGGQLITPSRSLMRVIIAGGVALFAACTAGTSNRLYVPSTSLTPSYSLIRSNANPLPACTTQSYGAPGKYKVLTALGTFSGNSFSGSGLSLWASVSVKPGREDIPIIKLPYIKTPYTVYYGTYKLSGLVGCFYLAKVSYPGVSFDGVAAAVPNVKKFSKPTPTAEGPLAIAITGISAKSGTGTLTLKDAASGKILDSGTVSIHGSKTVK